MCMDTYASGEATPTHMCIYDFFVEAKVPQTRMASSLQPGLLVTKIGNKQSFVTQIGNHKGRFT